MSKKKTFKRFVREEVLGVKPEDKQFDKFEDYVKDVRGYKPPENKADSFEQFLKETKGYEPPEHKYDSFEQMKEEAREETKQQLLEERKIYVEPTPIIITDEQIEKANRALIFKEINEVLKFRDPVLEKMTFKQWLKIPHNKFVFELDEHQADLLYEQDMWRAEKYQIATTAKARTGRSGRAGGGVRERKVTVVPWTPEKLCTGPNDNYWHAGAITGYNDGDAVMSISPVVGSGAAWARVGNSSWYRPSIASCNNQPGIEFDALWDGYKIGNVGSDYDFVADAQPWSIAFCMRPSTLADPGGTPFFHQLKMNDEVEGGMHHGFIGPWKFGGTTDPGNTYFTENLNLKRFMITSDGSTADIRDDGVGLSVTGKTVGSSTAHSQERRTYHQHQFLLEWIFLIGHELTAAEQTLLDDYWTDKYGT